MGHNPLPSISMVACEKAKVRIGFRLYVVFPLPENKKWARKRFSGLGRASPPSKITPRPKQGTTKGHAIPRVWQFAIRWKTSLLLMSCTFRLRTKYCYSLCLRIKPHISITNIVFFTTINTIIRDFPRFFPASYRFRPGIFPT
jgi:hypothetical protein